MEIAMTIGPKSCTNTPHTAQSLQTLKLPDLKAICKELKIPISKLKKEELVHKILETTGNSASSTVNKDGSKAKDSAKKRKTAETSTKARPKKSKTAIASPDEIPETDDLDKPRDQGGSESTPGSSTEHMMTGAMSSLLQMTADTTLFVGDINRSSNSTAFLNSAEAPPDTTAKASPIKDTNHIDNIQDEMSKDRRDLRTSGVSKTTLAEPRSQISSKPLQDISQPSTTLSTTNKSSQRSKAVLIQPVVHAPTKFIPLKTVVSRQTQTVPLPATTLLYPLTPLNYVLTDPLAIAQNRVDHVRSHFLNRLLTQLNRNRSQTVTSHLLTGPGPIIITHPDSGSEVAFHGLHSSLYTAAFTTVQFEVALRFWIARLHTLIQLGRGHREWSDHEDGLDLGRWSVVVDCREVACGIWSIVLEGSSAGNDHSQEDSGKQKTKQTNKAVACPKTKITRHLIIGLTGEVIATSPSPEALHDPAEPKPQLLEGCEVRDDWSVYIMTHPRNLNPASSYDQTWTPHVKTKDKHEYPGGIHRAWKNSVEAAKKVGWQQVLEVANKAALNGCVLNSFSGTKLSSLEMDAEWRGNGTTTSSKKSTEIEFYLPESHQVLSVNFPGPPIHPALAVVTRSAGISEWVLKETGQYVGSEDDGVVSVWRGLLGCDARGREVAMEDEAIMMFWTGWEARLGGIEAEFM